MKHPTEMRGWNGVLSVGISLVSIMYAACGFFGYITYGEHVKESITLNMNDGLFDLGLKMLLALVVYTGYLLQLYTLATILRPSVIRCIEKRFNGTQKMLFIADHTIRSGIVILSFLFAVLIPNLENLIPLVGVTAGIFLALIIPAVVDVSTFLPSYLEHNRYTDVIILLLNNLFFLAIGVFFVIVGLDTNIQNLIK
ncbi:hypothetical protein DICVIV_04944 [Dictyocaulus viviparus]|uniref:Amino acid transporter transmembrane domain-containing protein n=1 Tax=Dictyocaulus viviparus TaxID=29172 RepID=A0A0D8XWM4_DICVI|nr:hypothetical protein DICVIV_04944 [Dictyocaulus viviparus]